MQKLFIYFFNQRAETKYPVIRWKDSNLDEKLVGKILEDRKGYFLTWVYS